MRRAERLPPLPPQPELDAQARAALREFWIDLLTRAAALFGTMALIGLGLSYCCGHVNAATVPSYVPGGAQPTLVPFLTTESKETVK